MAKTGKASAKKQVAKKKVIAKKPAKAAAKGKTSPSKAAAKGPQWGPATFRQLKGFKTQGDYFQLNKKYAGK